MCGIAGVFARDGRADLGRLHRMSRLLRHRGPDGEGMVLLDPSGAAPFVLGGADTPHDVYAADLPWAPGRAAAPADAVYPVGLLHRRLAIVDLTPSGHEPMCDPDRRVWITYNGEIYNFVELRTELQALGHRFLGTSDTEVMIAAWKQWGRECLHRFNGMFAFALWDASRGELFCARDRFGVKPFYYQLDAHGFAFASEPEALVRTQALRVTPRLEAIRDLLALDWVDHEARTFFEGTWALPPGHCMTVTARSVGVERWYALDPTRHAPGDARAWREEFERLFTDAVRLRLRADVEVGACLSGGTDSSAVVTTAARLMDRPIHAFTCAYDEGPAWDERAWVRATVEASGATSHVTVPDGADFWAVFDRLHVRQSEPTAGPGLFSQWKVMELAHAAGLKVLLDGQGADETLAGYFRYLPARLRDLVAGGHPLDFGRAFGPTVSRLGLSTTLAHTFEPWLPSGLVQALRRRFGQGKDRVLSPALRKLDASLRPAPPRDFPTHLGRHLAFDLTQRLLPSLLRYEDRNSMAFSIETRLPFLDWRLVEFAFALPDHAKLSGDTTKAILRESLADRIPKSVLDRRDKMGFETPLDPWLRGTHAGEVRRRLLGHGPLHDWVNADVLRDELELYLAGRRDIGLQVWRWLSLQSWAERHLARDPRIHDRGHEPPERFGNHRSYAEQARRVAAESEPEVARA
jgi:asparagine synthase (glutamine-hydrolysing)